jgi:hypothetical protein
MGVGSRPDILEIRFYQRLFVGRKRASRGGCLAGAEEKDCDEGRENGQGEAAKFSVGQGGSLNLLTLIHRPSSRQPQVKIDIFFAQTPLRTQGFIHARRI